jgi:hypothetical protein
VGSASLITNWKRQTGITNCTLPPPTARSLPPPFLPFLPPDSSPPPKRVLIKKTSPPPWGPLLSAPAV